MRQSYITSLLYNMTPMQPLCHCTKTGCVAGGNTASMDSCTHASLLISNETDQSKITTGCTQTSVSPNRTPASSCLQLVFLFYVTTSRLEGPSFPRCALLCFHIASQDLDAFFHTVCTFQYYRIFFILDFRFKKINK